MKDRGGARWRNWLRLAAAAALGAAMTLAVVGILFTRSYLDKLPAPELWHHVELDAEFTSRSDVTTLAQYRELEDRLFEQLDERVYRRVPEGPELLLNRFSRGSLADPSGFPGDWNRTFELVHPSPRAGVLLLHGMSDSPYSLRALGETLHAHGAWVVGLRLPGHGTAPSGLLDVRWPAMAAATRLAARHLDERVGEAPLYLIGYSNGATLAVHHALAALDDDTLPPVDGLVLLSPSIAVSPLARFAVWQARVGHWVGVEKLAWNSIQPEYDPYKYGSFAINAGDQVYRLTVELQRQLDRAAAQGGLESLPPILAFQSTVDGTVSARAVLERLYFRLPRGGHELVLFDLNRREELEPFLIEDPRDTFLPLLENHRLDFTLDVVTNVPGTSQIELWRKEPGAPLQELPLDLPWPADVYSLSHVALPFPPEDPLYGGRPSGDVPLHLGTLAQRGERGIFRVGGDSLLRLRWNPFFPLVEERTLAFLGLALPHASELEAASTAPRAPEER